jgi:soluble lytic murein transglycosylase
MLCVLGMGLAPHAGAQGVFSYIDGNGVRTLTNIPPTAPVRDLEISPSAIAAVQAPAPGPVTGTAAPGRYDHLIERYAGEHRLDPSLIRAMIVQESNYNPRAVSRKGARGLMQLMPETAARLGVRDTFDPEENLRGGIRHMRALLDMFGNDLVLSLAAYNAGENLVARIRRVPNIAETRGYVRSITARYGRNTHAEPGLAAAGDESPAAAPLYRFTDPSGVVHLTNLAPIQRPGDSPARAAALLPE